MVGIRQDKIKFFQKEILSWFQIQGRNFLWRRKGLSNYQYIITEVLLQRTKAETVAKFYPNFLKTFPTWRSLVNANIEILENYLKPVGLYRQRSRRLIGLAQEMVRR